LYTIDTGLARGTEFAIEWRLLVRSADPHNFLDAGVAFMPSYSSWPGTREERDQMIYFDMSAIGFADDTQSYSMATTVVHIYRLAVDSAGNATVSVDGTDRLTRSNLTINGTIAFGDHTNDAMVDGDFEISQLRIITCP
jgi:hypothetical protein